MDALEFVFAKSEQFIPATFYMFNNFWLLQFYTAQFAVFIKNIFTHVSFEQPTVLEFKTIMLAFVAYYVSIDEISIMSFMHQT